MKLIDFLMEAVRRFTVGDFVVFKLFLCLFGIVLGMYFPAFFLAYREVVWALVVVAGAVVLARLIALGKRG